MMGDNTVPGISIHPELEELLPTIFQSVRDFGCDFYPTVVQMLTYDEISEVAAYGGFPVRWPHWKWGMEYEELQRGYEYGMHRIYEMVVNTNPCYIYCLDSNTLMDNVMVVAHALGHCDFFKNNVFFDHTDQNMMNKLANHGTRVRKYIKRWGKEKVIKFIDYALRIENLIDPGQAWVDKEIKDIKIRDSRNYYFPKRLPVPEGHDHMEGFVNPQGWIEKQKEKIGRKENAEQLGLFKNPTKDVMGYIRDNAPLAPWQADIISMLHEESMYFYPQGMTKTLNEGWASYIDYQIMCGKILAGLGQKSHDCGIIEYAKHKMGVLGGKYSTNPYKLGFCLFLDIEERWNKGRFGREYEECQDLYKKQNWDTGAGLGHEKVFEVRKYYNDLTALMEFFTPEFCEKYEFFEWKKYPNGDIKIESRDYDKIKKNLVKKYLNRGLPEIQLADPNHKGKGHMFLEHIWDGRTLYPPYIKATLQAIYYFWKNDVYLSSRNSDGEEIIFFCIGNSDEDVGVLSREEYEL